MSRGLIRQQCSEVAGPQHCLPAACSSGDASCLVERMKQRWFGAMLVQQLALVFRAYELAARFAEARSYQQGFSSIAS